MSTHKTYCAWCGDNTYCCDDTHVLGAKSGCHGAWPPVEFCSASCLLELRHELEEALKRVKERPEEYPAIYRDILDWERTQA